MALKEEDVATIKKIGLDAAHEGAGEISHKQTITVVRTTLEAFGMDVDNPLLVQQDLAHLRKAREDSHDTKKATKDAAIRWTVNGLFILIVSWLATNSPWGGGGLSGH